MYLNPMKKGKEFSIILVQNSYDPKIERYH
jgi:hypothetical protein